MRKTKKNSLFVAGFFVTADIKSALCSYLLCFMFLSSVRLWRKKGLLHLWFNNRHASLSVSPFVPHPPLQSLSVCVSLSSLSCLYSVCLSALLRDFVCLCFDLCVCVCDCLRACLCLSTEVGTSHFKFTSTALECECLCVHVCLQGQLPFMLLSVQRKSIRASLTSAVCRSVHTHTPRHTHTHLQALANTKEGCTLTTMWCHAFRRHCSSLTQVKSPGISNYCLFVSACVYVAMFMDPLTLEGAATRSSQPQIHTPSITQAKFH